MHLPSGGLAILDLEVEVAGGGADDEREVRDATTRLVGDALGVAATGVALALGAAPVWTTDELQLVTRSAPTITSVAERIIARG